MKIDYQEIVKAELLANDVSLCTACASYHSHSRGFAIPDEKIIHYNKKIKTRNTLYGFLHEIGHIVLNHGHRCKLRRYEKESQAEDYARKSTRALGITVPRKSVILGNAYISRFKMFGDKIKKAKGGK